MSSVSSKTHRPSTSLRQLQVYIRSGAGGHQRERAGEGGREAGRQGSGIPITPEWVCCCTAAGVGTAQVLLQVISGVQNIVLVDAASSLRTLAAGPVSE